MTSQRGLLAISTVLISIAPLIGCAVVDQYSYRAVAYNLEAEQALEEGLLLNVVRGSQRRPMQFTSVQSISGTASASGNASLTFPFGANSGNALKTGLFSAGVSGGPTFAVPVLDTQEFYQGILNPIQSQLLDFYVHEEYPLAEVFTLFFEKIILRKEHCKPTDHTLDCELVFVNYPGSDVDFEVMQSLIEHLVTLGLTTEPTDAPAKSADDASPNTSDTVSKGVTSTATSSSEAFGFCFAPRDPLAQAQIGNEKALCGFKKKATPPKPKATNTVVNKHIETKGTQTESITDIRGTTVSIAPAASAGEPAGGRISRRSPFDASLLVTDALIDHLTTAANVAAARINDPSQAVQLVRNLRLFRHARVSFSIYTRGTEGILYFLGEVVRRSLYPGSNPNAEPISWRYQVQIEKSFYRHYSEVPCAILEENEFFSCQNLFVVEQGVDLGAAALSVDYNGQHFVVPNDPQKSGKTLHVLSIVKQLLAVNTSAKSLPQTNVISIISP